MAIGIFRSLEFGGVNSADYGVYITGEGVYDAPERSVEEVSVPGRNGAIIIDNGHFENIEVTYKAGVTGANQGEFAENIADFRNAILSQKGYQRLTDEYNPNEYRMATYVSGLEVEATEGHQGTVGEFELTFNCKPQRFLTSGETPITVTSGDTITNPTRFDAEPLLEVEGYGTVGLNGYEIKITDDALGETSLDVNSDKSISISQSILNQGDVITFGILRSSFVYQAPSKGGIASNTFTITTDTFGSAVVATSPVSGGMALGVVLSLNGFSTTYEDKTLTATASGQVTHTGGYVSSTITTTITMDIDTSAGLITTTITITEGSTDKTASGTLAVNNVSAYSTVSSLGHPTYIDCELGEAYVMKGGSFVSLNHLIDLGSQLPVLSPGSNEITCDNTITSLDITPRWWEV